jgi:hypothetical protein
MTNMQTTVYPKMDWQTVPKKNMVANSPLEIGSKFESRKALLEAFEKIIKNPPYPDYRFSCPLCGSLDVVITINEKIGALALDCLDCEKIWFEDKLEKLEVAHCLC